MPWWPWIDQPKEKERQEKDNLSKFSVNANCSFFFGLLLATKGEKREGKKR